jgi:hypothetical protein
MIDPIPVEEEMARILKERALLEKRGNGALALAWFSQYALSKTGSGPRSVVQGVLPDELKPVASATPGVEKVLPYIRAAFRESHRGIVERAIELARKDFEGGLKAPPES